MLRKLDLMVNSIEMDTRQIENRLSEISKKLDRLLALLESAEKEQGP